MTVSLSISGGGIPFHLLRDVDLYNSRDIVNRRPVLSVDALVAVSLSLISRVANSKSLNELAEFSREALPEDEYPLE